MTESMAKMSYYELLGVPIDADINTIKRAYRSQITHHHPDRAGDVHMASQLNIAYATLKDPQQRAQYDAYLFFNNQKLAIQSAKKYALNVLQKTAAQGKNILQQWRVLSRRAYRAKDLPICQLDLSVAMYGGNAQLILPNTRMTVCVNAGIHQGALLHFCINQRSITAVAQIVQAGFVIDGMDIHYLVKLTKEQAKYGATIRLPAPIALSVTVPSGKSYPAQICVHQRGIQTAKQQGDLFVRFEVE